jgi:hypothetical protein
MSTLFVEILHLVAKIKIKFNFFGFIIHF